MFGGDEVKKPTKKQIDALAEQFFNAAIRAAYEIDRTNNPSTLMRTWEGSEERQKEGFRAVARTHLKLLKGEK